MPQPVLPRQSAHHDHDHGAGHSAHDKRPHHKHDEANHNHDHDHHSHGSDSERRIVLALALTSFFMVIELAGGLLAHSLTLVADAGHMLTDAAGLAMAWAALHFARRPADRRRSFGYQRLQVLAAFVNGVALFVIVGWIAIESVQRLFAPSAVNSTLMLIIASIGAVVNLIGFAILRHGDEHDLNMKAAVLHVIGDLLSSLAAIVASLIIMASGWTPIDPILSLLVCALITRSAYAIVKKSTHILMEGAPDWLDVTELRAQLKATIPAIVDIHHVHCWSLAPQQTLLTMHILLAPNADHTAVMKAANEMLSSRFGIDHATIQLDVEDCIDVDCAHIAPARRHTG
jgi:cobalt-zinc-cadmium efflux system protein